MENHFDILHLSVLLHSGVRYCHKGLSVPGLVPRLYPRTQTKYNDYLVFRCIWSEYEGKAWERGQAIVLPDIMGKYMEIFWPFFVN